MKTDLCKNCNILIRIGWDRKNCSKYCGTCSKITKVNKNYVDWSKITKGEFKSKFQNIYQFHARMRGLSRSRIKESVCKNCNYSKHIEVCHIKPISDFPDSATIEEINCVENLIPLCPNCHWEFDNGLITLK